VRPDTTLSILSIQRAAVRRTALGELSMNTSATLEEAILDSELHYINFFNGRLLSGEDLTADRDALRGQARYLGQALGGGVATGLEVTRAPDGASGDVRVQIKAGLAVNHAGQTLHLESDQLVSLVVPPDPATQVDCVFSDCSRLPASSTLSTGGYYILTIAPASQREGLAPVNGLGNSPAPCNSRYFTEGVQFRLVPLPVSPAPDAAHARNLVAYQCFGALDPAVQSFLKDPFNTDLSSYGLVDQVDPQRLTPADVPLAVVSFDALDGLQFIDMWSVRRRIVSPSPSGRFFGVTADRSTAEAQAVILQFQNQVGDIVANETNLASIKATDRFKFLPPVGIIPIGGMASSQGFDSVGFFQGLTCLKPLFIEGAKIRPLIHDALSFPPIDLSSKELIWQYLVRDNFQAFDNAKANPPQPCLIFANGQISFRAAARYDLSRWSYSNFS
jgi:hypothetical protein